MDDISASASQADIHEAVLASLSDTDEHSLLEVTGPSIAELKNEGFSFPAPFSSVRRSSFSSPSSFLASFYLFSRYRRTIFRYLEIPQSVAGTVVVAPIGLVPKQPTGYRLIHDLSAGLDTSVNAAIDPEDARTHYGTIANAIEHITRARKNVYLAKIDFKDAFRHCRIRPEEVHLLGLRWQGSTYVDLCLPFGLRTSPAIFNELAHVALWIAQRVVRCLHRHVRADAVHYLDDYLLITDGHVDAMDVMATIMETFRELGLRVNDKKCVDPTKALTFLGVELDVVARIARLPEEKRQALQTTLLEALAKEHYTKRELLSLAGQLFHAAKVVSPGRTFTASVMTMAYSAKRLHDVVRVTQDNPMLDDLRWWQQILRDWNGIEFWDYTPALARSHLQLAIQVCSDASSTVGFGLICGGEWTYGCWSARSRDYPIHVKELIPLVLAARLWGQRWAHRRVTFECDNMAVVQVVNDGYPKDPALRWYLRQL